MILTDEYLTLILQNLIIFPSEEIKLEFNNEQSKKIIDKAICDYSSRLIIVNPLNKLEINPKLEDLDHIGIIVKIKKKIIMPNGNIRVNLTGEKRTNIKSLYFKDGFVLADTESIKSDEYDPDLDLAYTNKIKNLVAKYVNSNSEVSNEIIGIMSDINSIGKLVDVVSISLNLDNKTKKELFDDTSCYDRAKKLIKILSGKIKETDLDKEIDEEIRDNFEKNEKDILIREKIKVLNSKLTYQNGTYKDVDKYLNELKDLSIPEKIKKDINNEIDRLASSQESSPEYGILKSHIDFVLSLPWNKSSEDNGNIKEVDDNLNKFHYGLEEVKTRIEEYLVLKKNNKNLPSPVLCLVGPPGTGKTTFAKELASSIGRQFIKVSVAGLNDSSELVGHRRTYMGAGAGKIMEGIRRSNVNNPLILIDEVDKIVRDYRGDPAGTLLDILDSNQNKYFVDNYVGEEFDLSNVIFILTANNKNNIPAPLLDRLEIIDISSYTVFDKLNIAKKYTIPRLAKEYNFDDKKIHINNRVLIKIITEYTNESGVRDLERNIDSIIRKILIKGLKKDVYIKESDVSSYLGPRKYETFKNIYNTYGITNVPALTSFGGAILNIECTMYKGHDFKVTGSVGNIMNESAMVAFSYIKANALELHIEPSKFYNSFHIHALDGSSNKDGSSGGLAITMALVSLMLQRKVPNDIAFTGEISLSGRILRVGGIKEKIITCYNNKIKKVYMPLENIDDLNDIPKKVINSISIVPVSDFTEVYKQIFS